MTRRTTPHQLRRPALPAPDDEPQSTERPTVNPPFDVAAFARESESKLRALGARPVKPAAPSSGILPFAADTPEVTGRTIDDPLTEMRERCALGDFRGALELAELILSAEPDNLDAAECGEDCRGVLEEKLLSGLGSLARVPFVAVPRSQLLGLSVDHRAGFILSLVDGASNLEMILDVCAMPRLDALEIVDDLVRRKILAFR